MDWQSNEKTISTKTILCVVDTVSSRIFGTADYAIA